jgi:hypothetical protein
VGVTASGTSGALTTALALTGPAQYWRQDADGSATYIAGGGSLTARFACTDAAAGIARVEVQPYKQAGDGSLSPATSTVTTFHFTGTNNVSSVALTDASLVAGATYRLAVRVTNAAGLTTSFVSRPVQLVAATRPSLGAATWDASSVLVAGNAATGTPTLLAVPSSVMVCVASATVSSIGADSLTVALGSRPGASDVAAPVGVTVGLSGSPTRLCRTVTGLSLADGALVYASWQLTDMFGMTATASSDAATVDTTPPRFYANATLRLTLPTNYPSDAGWPASVTGAKFTATLPVTDAASGVSSVRVVLVTPAAIAGCDLTAAATAASACLSAAALAPAVTASGSAPTVDVPLTGIALADRTTVHAALLATNGAGLAALSVGAPMRVALGNNALVAGTATVGTLSAPSRGMAITGLHTTSGIAVRWAGFVGPQDASGRSFAYDVALGLTPGGAQLSGGAFIPAPFLTTAADSNSLATSFVLAVNATTAGATDGARVFATVRARSTVTGAEVNATAPAVVLDTTPPVVVSVAALADSAARAVTVSYTCSDPDSGVAEANVTLSLASGSTLTAAQGVTRTVRGSLAAAGAVRITGVSAVDGAPLVAAVVCTNGIGLVSEAAAARTAQTAFDTTAPAVSGVRVGGARVPAVLPPLTSQAVDTTTAFSAVWQATDGESGIATITACLGNGIASGSMIPCTTLPGGAQGVAFIATPGTEPSLNASTGVWTYPLSKVLPTGAATFTVTAANTAGLSTTVAMPVAITAVRPVADGAVLAFARNNAADATWTDVASAASASISNPALLPIVWSGVTAAQGVPIVAYVVSLTTRGADNAGALRAALPSWAIAASTVATFTRNASDEAALPVVDGRPALGDFIFATTLPLSGDAELVYGQRYELTLTAFDAVGAQASVAATFAPTSTPPTVADAGAIGASVAPWTRLDAYGAAWDRVFADADPASLTFAWTVCPREAAVTVLSNGFAEAVPSASDGCLFDPIPTGHARTGFKAGLALDRASSYVVRVSATNAVGLTVTAQSRAFTIVDSAPIPGAVTWPAYTASLTGLAVTLAPFMDAASAAVDYSLALGNATGMANLLPWTRVSLAAAVPGGTTNESTITLTLGAAGMTEDVLRGVLSAAGAAWASSLTPGAQFFVGLRGVGAAGLPTVLWAPSPVTVASVAPALPAGFAHADAAFMRTAGFDGPDVLLPAAPAHFISGWRNGTIAVATGGLLSQAGITVAWLPLADPAGGAVTYTVSLATSAQPTSATTLIRVSAGAATQVTFPPVDVRPRHTPVGTGHRRQRRRPHHAAGHACCGCGSGLAAARGHRCVRWRRRGHRLLGPRRQPHRSLDAGT